MEGTLNVSTQPHQWWDTGAHRMDHPGWVLHGGLGTRAKVPVVGQLSPDLSATFIHSLIHCSVQKIFTL